MFALERPTALDRQLGLSYGAAAVLALHGGTTDVTVAFEASELKLVALGGILETVKALTDALTAKW